MNREMKALIDAPLADPLKLYLPQGKRKATRAKKPVYDNDIGCPKLKQGELQQRKERAVEDKLEKLLAYYAATDLSNERIAEHTGLDASRIEREMLWRRRNR